MAKRPEIVVVGGGVVGCAAAYYLARDGRSVSLLERDAVASHASGFAYGGLTPVLGIVIDDPLVPLSRWADRLHAELARSLPAETGIDTEYREKESVTLAVDREAVEAMRALFGWLESHHSGEVRWLEGDDLRRLESRISERVPAGMWANFSHEVEPYKFTLALAQAAERHGAQILNAAASGLVVEGGSARGVRTERGVLECEAVVLAAGPWMSDVSAWAGCTIPVSPLKGQILRLKAPGRPLSISLSWGGDYATTKPDGLVWAGTTEEQAGFDETPTTKGRDEIMASLVAVLPYLADAALVRQTACLRPVAPDGLPLLGPIPGLGGAFVATGTGRKGILLGPAMGRAVADIATGKTPPVDVSGLRLERFSGLAA